MRTTRLFTVALLPLFGVHVSAQTVEINWNASIYPVSQTLSVSYDYGSETYIREVYLKDVSLGIFGPGFVQNDALTDLNALMSGSGTETILIPSGAFESDHEYEAEIRLLPLGELETLEEPRPRTDSFQLLPSPTLSSEILSVSGADLTIQVTASYGEMYPHDSLRLVTHVSEVNSGVVFDPIVDAITPGYTVYQMIDLQLPFPGVYHICFDLWYKDSGWDPLWDWTFITSTCGDPLVYDHYGMTTGLESGSIDSADFWAYPNPAVDQVTVLGFNTGLPLELYDLNGRLVQTNKAISTLDVSGVHPGIYLLKQADGRVVRLVKNP
jgi:hypothetical protein